MNNHKSNKPSPLVAILGIAAAILALGAGAAWWAKYSLQSEQTTPTTSEPPTTITQEPPIIPKPDTPSQQQKQVTICWLNPTTNQVELVSKTLNFPKSAKPENILQTAFDQLFAGPSQSAEYTTTIPDGTKILNILATSEGIKIDLSQEFMTGGGSAAMTGRLAQVVYTATSLDIEDKVWISVEGKPLTNLGGEGILVSQPITRQEFKANFQL